MKKVIKLSMFVLLLTMNLLGYSQSKSSVIQNSTLRKATEQLVQLEYAKKNYAELKKDFRLDTLLRNSIIDSLDRKYTLERRISDTYKQQVDEEIKENNKLIKTIRRKNVYINVLQIIGIISIAYGVQQNL